MPWNNPVINGSNSVSSNKTPLNQNSAYIETTQQVDHFWDNGNSNYDGHHDVIESISQSGTPTLSTDMTSAMWSKDIAQPARATDLTEPYYRGKFGGSTFISQFGLVRAMVNFDGRGTNGAATVNYSYNVSGVSRTGTGVYVVTFTTALPSASYVPCLFSFKSGNKLSPYTETAFATGTFTIKNADFNTGSETDPTVCTLVIFGG